ncbi:LytTR family transcriptional regulator DNA-binding domain-containing protein [Lachnoclostridium phytofermentans]|uniref:Response regulator receiver protein n=1 Tax=Lachnoclostridium phytofermentans (strain ATCC 700394 / DSM 18823 / ISDg) TaxID=357809 RepID=A9KIT5_LACP7|nr:LytTR family transcriptional regulator DNA-binding domain-containing protein [Lachnoclostridium phytofermentans]ABX43948.1 response regulator receiver protein [Lachnoclostridium phytofermentans ISDg]
MPLLEMNEVCIIEGNRYSLPRLNLRLGEKDFVVIKTTNDYLDCLIRLMEGKLDHLKGKVEVSDKRIYVLYNEDGIYKRDNIASYLNFFNKISSKPLSNNQLDGLLRVAGLLEGKKKKIGSLNSLEKQCLHLIRTVSLNPGVIVLKNPLQILNPNEILIYRELLQSIVREYEVAILLLTNNLEDALNLNVFTYLYDQIGLRPFDNGEMVEIDKKEVCSKEERKETYKIDYEKVNDTKKVNDTETDSKQAAKDVTKIERTIIVPPIMKISCRYDDKLLLFSPDEIDYAESVDGETYVNVNGKAFQATLTLTQLEERLRDYGFFRCHRSYIINIQKIREIISYSRGSYVLRLSNYENSQIPLSRQKLEEMKELLHI